MELNCLLIQTIEKIISSRDHVSLLSAYVKLKIYTVSEHLAATSRVFMYFPKKPKRTDK